MEGCTQKSASENYTAETEADFSYNEEGFRDKQVLTCSPQEQGRRGRQEELEDLYKGGSRNSAKDLQIG